MPSNPQPKNIRFSKLNNGLKIITENIKWVKSCSIGIFIEVGSVFEGKNEYGYSHFLEHMLFRGTKKHSAQDLYKIIERVGGSINAFTSREYTCYYGKIISDNFDILLNVLNEIVFMPLLPKAAMGKEKQVVIQEISANREDPFDYITDIFVNKLWPGQVFGRNILGNKTSIRLLKNDRLKQFYQRHYNPQNIIVAASGNIEHNKFIDIMNNAPISTFANSKNDAKVISVDRGNLGYGKYFVKDDTDQYHIFYGFETFGRRDKRRSVSTVINLALGGPMMTARLYTKMRDLYGIAYDVNTYLSMLYDSGMFGVYVATNKANVPKAIHLIEEELQDIVLNSLKNEEFETILAQIKNNLVFEQESTGRRMLSMGVDIIYYGKNRNIDEILAEYNAITQADVKAVAREIFSKKPLIMVLGKNHKEINLK